MDSPYAPESRVRAGARTRPRTVSVRGRGRPGGRPSAQDEQRIFPPARGRSSAPDGSRIPMSDRGRIPAPVFTHVTGVTTRFANKLPTFWNDRVHILSDIETDGQ